MKLNEIDIKTRLLAKLPSVYGYHKLINSKYQFPLSTPTQLLSYIFPF